MSKQILLMAGAALLFAGASQAGTPELQDAQERSALVQKEAPAPTASGAAANAAGNTSTNEAEQELSPGASPVYLDGGHFGGSDY